MATFKFILSHHAKSGDVHAIRLRITKNRTASFLSTGEEVAKKDWDEKGACARKSLPSLNIKLNRFRSEIQEKIYEMERKNPHISLHQIMDALTNKTSSDMMAMIKKYVYVFQKDDMINFESFRSRYHNILRYVKDRPVLMEEVTVEWLNKFQVFMKDEGYAQKTIASHLSLMRTVFISAAGTGVIQYSQNPFNNYKIVAGRSAKKEPLTLEEINKMKQTIVTENVDFWLYHAKMAWMFSAFTIGLRVRDMLTLQWGAVVGKQVTVTAHKTDKTINFVLNDQAWQILQLYKHRNTSSKGYVFPFLEKAMANHPERHFERHIKDCTKWMNQGLERLAKYAGIEKKISNHSARNTFINQALENGVTGFDLLMLTQHSDLRTMENYISEGFHNPRVNEIMKRAHKE